MVPPDIPIQRGMQRQHGQPFMDDVLDMEWGMDTMGKDEVEIGVDTEEDGDGDGDGDVDADLIIHQDVPETWYEYEQRCQQEQAQSGNASEQCAFAYEGYGYGYGDGETHEELEDEWYAGFEHRQDSQTSSGVSKAMLRVEMGKTMIEKYFADWESYHEQRMNRKKQLEQQMDAAHLGPHQRRSIIKELCTREMAYIRTSRLQKTPNEYEKIKMIGKGAFGQVWLVKNRSSGLYSAMKQLKKSEMLRRGQSSRIWSERYVLATAGKHPSMVELYSAFQDEKHLYLIMEFARGGDLATMLSRRVTLPESWVKFYCAELVVALETLHSLGVIHRDIKPDNILFADSGHLLLSDFGLCRLLYHELDDDEDEAEADAEADVNSPTTVSIDGEDTPSDHNSAHSNSDHDCRGCRSQTNSQTSPRHVRMTSRNCSMRRSNRHQLADGSSAPLVAPSSPHKFSVEERISGWQKVAKTQKLSQVGTPNYVAPEVLLLKNKKLLQKDAELSNNNINVKDIGYGEACDFWSLGILAYEMLVGFPPFYSDSVSTTIKNIMNFEKTLKFPESSSNISDVAKKFIMDLLQPADKRLGSKRGMDEFKEHPFFEGIDWDGLMDAQPFFVPMLDGHEDLRYFDEFDEADFSPKKASDQENVDPTSVNSVGPGTMPKRISFLRKRCDLLKYRYAAWDRNEDVKQEDLEFAGFSMDGESLLDTMGIEREALAHLLDIGNNVVASPVPNLQNSFDMRLAMEVNNANVISLPPLTQCLSQITPQNSSSDNLVGYFTDMTSEQSGAEQAALDRRGMPTCFDEKQPLSFSSTCTPGSDIRHFRGDVDDEDDFFATGAATGATATPPSTEYDGLGIEGGRVQSLPSSPSNDQLVTGLKSRNMSNGNLERSPKIIPLPQLNSVHVDKSWATQVQKIRQVRIADPPTTNQEVETL